MPKSQFEADENLKPQIQGEVSLLNAFESEFPSSFSMLRLNLIASFSTFSNYSSCLLLRKSNLISTTFPLLHFSTSGAGEPQSAAHSTLYQFLVHRHHFSPQSASKIASSVPHLRNPERSDSVRSFLKQTGFSISQLEKMVKALPELLSVDLEKIIKPKLKIFEDFGLSASDIVKIISHNPWICHRAANKLMPSLTTLKTLFGANGIAKLLGVCGMLLRADLDKALVPNVEFLRKCGLSMDGIIKLARGNPRILKYKPQDLKKIVEKVDEMGVSTSSKMFIRAVGMYPFLLDATWNIKEKTLRELGLSVGDIAAIFRKSPLVFGHSEKNLKHKIRTLGELGLSVDDIAAIFRKFPSVFSFSEKNLKHKIRTLGEMELSDYDIAAAFRKNPKLFSYSEDSLKLKVCTLKEIGFSDDDIAAAFKISPKVFDLSEEKIKRTKEVFVENGKYSLSCIAEFPVALTYSIEKRHKPRLQVLELLEGKNLIQRWPPFTSFCVMTDEKFREKYVVPFLSEIGDVYMAKSASGG